jgi:hypothetical protein
MPAYGDCDPKQISQHCKASLIARSALLLVGFYIILFKEGEKVLPLVKQPFCVSLHSLIWTAAKYHTEIVHTFPHKLSINPQLFPGSG